MSANLDSPPAIQLNGTTEPTTMNPQAPVQEFSQQSLRPAVPMRNDTSYSKFSTVSVPPEGSILTGKQEHYLKRELISQQTKFEIAELSSPTALRRFGAPFRSDAGEVAPEDSELPLLRYIFVNHVRNFPFLDKAKEKEFWQDKLQVFLESFASKDISSSEDRLEETKRRKLALKAEKLVELMMVSGIPTASGYEERIRFAEMEIVDRQADEKGLTMNAPSGHFINGWDINVAGVRTTSVKRHLRYHTHAEYIIRVKQAGGQDIYIGRRYADFVQLHKRIRLELPGKVLAPLPRKNAKDSLLQPGADDDDASSISSNSTQGPPPPDSAESNGGGGLRSYIFGGGHKKNKSQTSLGDRSPRPSADYSSYKPPRKLYREEQRVSLRAFLRSFLHNDRIARSNAMAEFLTHDPIEVNEEEMEDIQRREEMDRKRIEEQKQFYEVARKRAAELDIHMEKFRREIVESNGLSHLFEEVRVKNSISELKPEYQKFAEWLRIEVAATIYHLFLAEDNSPELFAQAKRIHSLVPYSVLKNVIRIANPAAVMSGVLDLFLAQPFGARSLLQRIFGMAINDGVTSVGKTIETLGSTRIKDEVLCNKIKAYVQADEAVKDVIREEAARDNVDVVVTILRSEFFEPELTPQQVEKVFNAYVAWNNAVENVRSRRLSRTTSNRSTTSLATNAANQVEKEMRSGAELFAHLKQYLKLCLRQRDKLMMLQIIEEPTTLQLFRDLFTIFYEPLVRVYKSANVYNSITDFALFADDTIKTIEACQRQEVSADPNQTVQAFIDLCARHEGNFYKFVHEVHKHDNGLFGQLMGWLEGILDFLRHGPGSGGKLDMNALFQGGMDAGIIDKEKAVQEINSLIKWQMARKKWHQDKTRQKMASGDEPDALMGGIAGFKSSDFGLNPMDLQDLELDADGSDSENSEDMDDADIADPIEAERKSRARAAEKLRRKAGEPKKPDIVELNKLSEGFNSMLRNVLAS
ncbi:PX domain containing protein [Pyrenophora tritici-repentis]|uniref:PX domain containing protein n=1 Tax=Pyrenophora tritici-repentis TaxID=45151 RepID=A0A2W1DX69_9PLEO|nr:PX domain-containing protein [Pyrenophora tritici-repentis]KAF7446465.1 PX domain containing protein [Pyrenophora tritici-repentis]KAF7567580.1 PX domain containing protein [Pyrenophora tritici-repentis]KAG9382163.1 PX domain containing protein [Pyrenophora tritici-repentis]KAI0580183.1 PX domain-containing protein [Pyrenophora tritici-repentis]